MYVMALRTGDAGLPRSAWEHPIKGVRYNVIRRPLSGGKGNIVRHKPTKSNPQGESKEHFYGRVATYIEEDLGSYFMRWTVGVTPQDVEKFRRTCLDPILEQLCDWWGWIGVLRHDPFDVAGSGGVHHITPYGVHNSLLDGGSTDLDSYLETGSTVGLERVEDLFPELG
jgi:hypothetical protein